MATRRRRPWSTRAFRALLALYPGEFRDEYGREVTMVFADRYREATSVWQRTLIWIEAVSGVLREAPKEHLQMILEDVRYAVRIARRSLGFSAVAILTLALGIGATTAILTVVNALLLRPQPFVDADRLVVLFATTPKRGIYQDTTSFLDFSDWRDQSHAFTGVAAYRRDPFNVTGDGAPEPIIGLSASHELFGVLGISPAIGRPFDKQEQQGKIPVALISNGLWMRRYGGDPSIVGRTIRLNEVSHTVVGVLPPGFQLPPFFDADVVVPVLERPGRSVGYIRGVARLKADVHLSAAQQELDTIAARLAEAFPQSNQGRGVNVVPLQEVAVGRVRTPLVVLLSAALFVLLIGCANVANLVLAKGIARQRELAVRSALGAGRRRLVRQLLTESVSLALVASLVGAALAIWGSELLVASLSQHFPLPTITFSWALLAFAFVIAVVSGVLCGLAPALMIWRSDLNDFLKQGARSQSASASESRLRNLLLVSETALTVMLLIGAGLLMKSFILLQQVDIGMNTRHVLTADLLLSKRYAEPARREVYLRELLESIGGLPGVQQVAVHNNAPFQGGGSRETFTVEGQPDPGPRNGHVAGMNLVSANFFRALDIPITRGRGFDERDIGSGAPVAIVNETMARRFWPNEDAIGKRLRFYYDKNPQRWLSIAGVVGDMRNYGRDLEPVPQIFVPYEQNPYPFLPYAQQPFISLVVRTATDPAGLAKAVEAKIWSVDKDQPISNLTPMEELLWQSVSAPRIYMVLLGIFAAIALVMATAGIYGLGSYAVARRTQEVGIRMALGATPAQILALVMRSSMLLTLVGVGLGVAGSLALRKVIAGFLYSMTATDGPTFVAMLILFAAVAFLAAYIPARRATAIDPTVAFRYDA